MSSDSLGLIVVVKNHDRVGVDMHRPSPFKGRKTRKWRVLQLALKSFGREVATHGPWLEHLRQSVAHDEYNAAAVIPLMPVYLLSGGDRFVYVTAVAALYLTPAALIAAAIAGRSAAPGRWTRALVLIAALFFPPFWNPTIRGYVDTVGLIPSVGGTFTVLRSRFLTRASVYEACGVRPRDLAGLPVSPMVHFSLIAVIAGSLLVAAALLSTIRPFSFAASRAHGPADVFAGVACLIPAYFLALAAASSRIVLMSRPLIRGLIALNFLTVYLKEWPGAASALRSPFPEVRFLPMRI